MTMHKNTPRRPWRGLGFLAVGAMVLTTCGTRVLTDAEPQSARVVSVCPTPGLTRMTSCNPDRADTAVLPTGLAAPRRDALAAALATALATATPATTAPPATAPPVTEPPTTVPAPPETPAPAPAEAAAPAPEEAAPEPEPEEPETPDTTVARKKKIVVTTPAPAPAPAPEPPAPEPPAPEETAPPAPAVVKADTSVAGRVISLINVQRQAAGLGPLAANGALNAAAAGHSKDQASTGVMSHTGSNGSTVGARASAAGYGWRGIAENVAKGQGSADSVFNAWWNSAGHKANMLGASYTHAGVAVAYDAGGTPYWTLVLGAPA